MFTLGIDSNPIEPSSCGAHYEGLHEGYITSPNYPSSYSSNANCHWTISAEENTTITVNVEEFNTETGYDYLVIRDGSDSSAPELVRLQGSNSGVNEEFVSTGNNLYFYFRSDSSVQRSGFKFNWFAGSVTPDITCPDHYTSIGQDCFAFEFNPVTFNEAKVTCDSMNGQLGKITNAEQLRSLYVYMNDLGFEDISFWLGGSDKNDEGHFVYEDGTDVPQGTPFWGTQEPDGNQEENCVALIAEGFHFLRDVSCTAQMKFLCSPL
ncbi:unnamed protein product [Meganyctiphanes norvegica]|uniref:Uncharacterized protein n=1 Tax=Meganyctiphanes norvegica TaxID=48144 RepID=A0AAV2PZR7_MEGNR